MWMQKKKKKEKSSLYSEFRTRSFAAQIQGLNQIQCLTPLDYYI